MGWGISGIVDSFTKMKTKKAEARVQQHHDDLEYKYEMAQLKSDEKISLAQLQADQDKESLSKNYASDSYDLLSMELGANARKTP